MCVKHQETDVAQQHFAPISVFTQRTTTEWIAAIMLSPCKSKMLIHALQRTQVERWYADVSVRPAVIKALAEEVAKL